MQSRLQTRCEFEVQRPQATCVTEQSCELCRCCMFHICLVTGQSGPSFQLDTNVVRRATLVFSSSSGGRACSFAALLQLLLQQMMRRTCTQRRHCFTPLSCRKRLRIPTRPKAELVAVSKANVYLGPDSKAKQILHDVNLHVQQGALHMLVGPNGCGKVRGANTIC